MDLSELKEEEVKNIFLWLFMISLFSLGTFSAEKR